MINLASKLRDTRIPITAVLVVIIVIVVTVISIACTLQNLGYGHYVKGTVVEELGVDKCTTGDLEYGLIIKDSESQKNIYVIVSPSSGNLLLSKIIEPGSKVSIIRAWNNIGNRCTTKYKYVIAE